MRIRLSGEARAFLDREVRYLKARSPAAARHLLDRIGEAKRNLSLFPLMGSAEGSVVRGVRRLVVGDYVMTYDVADDTVAISSIRHGRMMPEVEAIEDDLDYEAP